eukprot:TRINITY_DN26306_c1_g1_i1.p1 TRINITY_DN26306_c1_g1~~TRINITY_DN26306_c1_g1_i1.p1  ORF type:complete len:522 (+),score=206.21 TRINITY_DN26306_c1_g1_i1:87-1568(+)
MYYSDAERAREEWRHQQCAKYLRHQMEQGPSPQRSAYGTAIPAAASVPRYYDTAPPPAEVHSPGHAALYVGGPCSTPERLVDNASGWRVFEFLDTNRDYKVDREEWAKGMEACNMAFSPETVSDLFEKAAPNGSDAISSGDWGGFCRRYPMLIDCLYHRFVSLRNADADLAEAEAARAPLAAASKRAEQEEEQAGRDLGGEIAAAEKEKEALDRAEAAREEAETKYRGAVEDANLKARQRTDAHRTMQQHWPEIQRRQTELHQAQRDCELAQRRANDAAERIKVLEQALRDAREEEDKARTALSDGQARIAELSKREGPDPEEDFRSAETALNEAQRAENDAASAMAEAQQLADRQRFREEEAQRRRDAAQRHKDAAAQQLEIARKAVEDNEMRRAAAETTKRDGPGKGLDGQVTEDAEKENKLVEEEVRLREQRDALEKRETVLREEHDSFTIPRKSSPPRERAAPGAAGAASPQSYGSPPQSGTPGRSYGR